jgi:hypothetical protein
MRATRLSRVATAVAAGLAALALGRTAEAAFLLDWTTVVNNGDSPPGYETTGKKYFSYNQPSINDDGLVVFRARAKKPGPEGGGGSGGTSGGPVRGIWTSQMDTATGSFPGPITQIAVARDTLVPAPNSLGAPFNEFPAFPRIDANTSTLAFRGQSEPVLEYQVGWTTDPETGEEVPETTRGGTSGVYTNPTGTLVTGASLLGNVSNAVYTANPDLSRFEVPGTAGAAPGTKFDQFPGAPSPDGSLVAFKGNYTVQIGTDTAGNAITEGKTGIFYRDVVAVGGTSPVQHIASSGMYIPPEAQPGGQGTAVFGSTAPPSAADGHVVFTGLDVEEAPTAGGIFLAPLAPDPTLTTLVGFNTVVPGLSSTATFNRFGEALSFDDGYVGFWGAWGTDTREVTVWCAADGETSRQAACMDGGTLRDGGNPDNPADYFYTQEVPEDQGIFLADISSLLDDNAGNDNLVIRMIAQTGVGGFDDFLFWNFSGAPETGGGDEGGDDREPPRWRSTSFVAVDGENVVFMAQKDGKKGLYGMLGGVLDVILETGMPGGYVDGAATGLPIIGIGVERDGFRNNRLAITASFADDENSWAGIYVTNIPDGVPPQGEIPEPGTLALGLAGLGGLGFSRRRKRG